MTSDRGILDRIVHGLSRGGANVATCALVLIMATAVVDVTARSLAGRSVPGIVESAEVILVIGVFLGLAYAQRLKAHVATSVIIDRLPPAARRVLRSAGLLVVAAYVGGAAYVSALRAWQSFAGGEVRFGLMEIPQWPARTAIAVGFALLLLEVLRDLRRAIAGEAAEPQGVGFG